MDYSVTSMQINVLPDRPAAKTTFSVQFPNHCTVCGKTGVPKMLGSYYVNKSHAEVDLFVSFLCTECNHVFTGYYKQINSTGIAKLVKFEPSEFIVQKEFSQYIKDVSIDFCRIYNQSFTAEQKGLNEIAGMGYRKALEFLVKDYSIFLHSDKQNEIKHLTLSKCITTYIDSQRIKTLATASAWIGNDETHYERKHQEYTVKDLTTFIDAIVSFIESDMASLKAEELINSNQT